MIFLDSVILGCNVLHLHCILYLFIFGPDDLFLESNQDSSYLLFMIFAC